MRWRFSITYYISIGASAMAGMLPGVELARRIKAHHHGYYDSTAPSSPRPPNSAPSFMDEAALGARRCLQQKLGKFTSRLASCCIPLVSLPYHAPLPGLSPFLSDIIYCTESCEHGWFWLLKSNCIKVRGNKNHLALNILAVCWSSSLTRYIWSRWIYRIPTN